MASAVAIITLATVPPRFSFVACLTLGLVVGMLYQKISSLFLWGCGSVAIGFIGAYRNDYLPGFPYDDLSIVLQKHLVVVMSSIAIFSVGRYAGKFFINKVQERIRLRRYLREIEDEYTDYCVRGVFSSASQDGI